MSHQGLNCKLLKLHYGAKVVPHLPAQHMHALCTSSTENANNNILRNKSTQVFIFTALSVFILTLPHYAEPNNMILTYIYYKGANESST